MPLPPPRLRPPRVRYYFPSARQVPPIPIRASATIPLPRVRYPPSPSARIPLPRVSYPTSPPARQLLSSLPRVRYASGAPHSRSARQPFSKLLFALPRVRYLPSCARQFHPYSHPLVSYYFPSKDSAHQVTPILIRASATVSLPRVRYPPPSGTPHPPSARQLLSSLPRVRYGSGAPPSRSARQPFSKLLFALPRVRYLPSSARQFCPCILYPFVSYYFPSAHQVTPILIRASATIFLPRVRYPTPIRASATILPSARQVCVRRSPLPVRASAFFEAAIRPAARQVPPLLRASVPPLRPSARQLLFSFRASGNPHPHPRVSYYFPSARQVPRTPIRASAAIPLPRVRYPPPPSARQLLSSLPRIRYPRVRCALA